jgi:hypothetical protein
MKTRLYLAALAAAVACTMPAIAQQAQPAQAAQPAASQQQPTESQARSRDILMHMARYLSSLPAFSVRIASNYDVLQASGEMIEFGEWRKLVVQRPNHLRVDTERSDGDRTTAVFNGKEIAVINVNDKFYASTPQPGGLDESILHFVSDLKLRLPLAMLIMTRLPAELERRVRSTDYVETAYLAGQPVHHLLVRGDTVDFQVWVRSGDTPLPLRVVITYKDEPGDPGFRADFADWNTHPVITEATFRAQPPQGAQKVAFAAQLMAASGTPNQKQGR